MTSEAAEHLTSVRGRVVRWLSTGEDPTGAKPLVVVLPGLGLTFYTRRTAAALAARGLPCAVLDLPGFGSRRPWPTRPDIHAIGLTAARWVESEAADRPVVVLGHSTGAQAALTAALALGPRRLRLSLVMAGPTFCPEQRRLTGLASATPLAYRSDRPTEIDPAEAWRGRTGMVGILGSGLRDGPEERIVHLRAPLTVTSGAHDAYAPFDWLDRLATSARNAPNVRTTRLGGSHNNLYTHAEEVADLVALAAQDAVRAG
ncbi:MAG TPA: alpha/beta hydrolase [Terrabacter sp.]|nr:alpha/beta hydrolase [Terrabacter sp.]